MRSPPTASLAKNSMTTSTIDTPMVTTVTMSRGACAKRRTSTTSVAAPSAAAPMITIGRTAM